MKFPLHLKPWLTTHTAINRCGYATFRDPNTGETSFVRRQGSYYFPRFHLYIQRQNGNVLTVALHLDMKQPTYLPGKSHSGEYEGPLVEDEAKRIVATVASLTPPSENRQDLFS